MALPPGNDPRLKMEPDDLSAASERALPQVARSGNGMDMTTVGGVAAVLLVGGIAAYFLFKSPAPPSAQSPHTPVVQVPQVQRPQTSLLPPIDPSVNPVEPQQPIVQPMPVQPQVQPPSQAENDGGGTALRSPALVIDNSSPQPGQANAAGGNAAPAGGSITLNSNDRFVAAVTGDTTQKAQKIGDPSKVVPQGAVIPAVLETAINSDLPGYTRAIVSRDIRSFDGTAVLIPRGSRLVGQYKSGLASGETRAFIIWTRLLRPDGLSVQLSSPSTDDLGQAGASGRVNTHFVKRFGAAMLLSVVNGLAGSLQGSNSSTIVIGTSTDAQNVATEALTNDVKIPPTIKVPQGAPIQVFAARDLDFGLQ